MRVIWSMEIVTLRLGEFWSMEIVTVRVILSLEIEKTVNPLSFVTVQSHSPVQLTRALRSQ